MAAPGHGEQDVTREEDVQGAQARTSMAVSAGQADNNALGHLQTASTMDIGRPDSPTLGYYDTPVIVQQTAIPLSRQQSMPAIRSQATGVHLALPPMRGPPPNMPLPPLPTWRTTQRAVRDRTQEDDPSQQTRSPTPGPSTRGEGEPERDEQTPADDAHLCDFV